MTSVLSIPLFQRLAGLFAPAKPKTVCAWCLKERGERPSPEHSHGICKRHFNAMKDELEQMDREKGGQ